MNKLLTLFLILTLSINFSHAQKGKVYSAAASLSEGDILSAKKSIDEALEDEAVQDMVKAWVTKGEVYTQIQQSGLAKEFRVTDAVEQAEDAFRKAYVLDMANEKKPGKNKNTIQDGLLNAAIGHFEKGAAAFNGQLYEASMTSFTSAAELIAYLSENDLIKAEAKADALQVQGDAYLNSALCALNLKEYDKAITIYENVIKMGDAGEGVYANLATLHISKEDYDAALPVVEAGRAQFPDNESLKESELNIYIGTGQSDKAVGKLEDAVAASPDNPDLYFNLALAYDKLDRTEDMIKSYEKIIELDPTYYGAYLNLGAHYNDEANEVIKTMNDMTDWREAVKLEPKRDEWYGKALPHLEKAYQLQPDEPAVRTALERIYANMNMLDKIKEMKGE